MFEFSRWLFLEENTREKNRFQNIEDRVRYGKEIESKIIKSLIHQGWEVSQVNSNQDKFDKIDGILISSKDPMPISLPAPIQIKYRDTGNDLLMEVCWLFDGNFNKPIQELLTGRDMKGKAELYVSLDQNGETIRVRLAKEAKENALSLLKGLLSSRKKVYSSELGQIRITKDPKDGRQKINAFINPNSFFWTKNYPIENFWSLDEDPKSLQSPNKLLPKEISPQMVDQITKALETGSASFKIPNNRKKLKF